MKVEVSDLGFSYGDTKVFEGVSFTANPGELTVIVGPNGAGKTTMIKCIAGLNKHAGKVLFDGEEKSLSESVKFLSFLDQNIDCDVELNVFEIVLLGKLGSLSYNVSQEDVDDVYEIMDLMGLSKFAGRGIRELSGGQRQLVLIAQALVKHPAVVIMDEPTSALDLYHQFKLMDFLKKVTVERNCTMIMTLHHLDVAIKFADEGVILFENKMYMQGDVEQVFTEENIETVYNVKCEIRLDKEGRKHIDILGPLDESGSLSDNQI